MGVICCVLEADRNNDIALVLAEDELLKVEKILCKRYCFKPVTRPKIFFWSEKINLSLLKWKPHQVLSLNFSLFFIRDLFKSPKCQWGNAFTKKATSVFAEGLFFLKLQILHFSFSQFQLRMLLLMMFANNLSIMGREVDCICIIFSKCLGKKSEKRKS